MLDPEKYGTRVWYRFITLGSLPYICSSKPNLNQPAAGNTLPAPRIRYWVRYWLSFRIQHASLRSANFEFVNTVVDPDFKFAANFFHSFTCPGFGAAACPIRPPPALCATRQPSFCTPLLLSRPFTGLKALLLPLVPPPVQRNNNELLGSSRIKLPRLVG